MIEQDYKPEFWKQWAVDGMPADKQRLADAAWQARQPEIDALSKELEQVKELHKDVLILLEQEECRHDETKEKLEQVKMHNVMLRDAAINADVTLSDYEYSDHFSRKGISNAITATSEQIESYRAEIIAQAKKEQCSSDYWRIESLPTNADRFDILEAIRNNKE